MTDRSLEYLVDLDEDQDQADRACLRDPIRRRRILTGLSAGALVSDRSWATGPIWIQNHLSALQDRSAVAAWMAERHSHSRQQALGALDVEDRLALVLDEVPHDRWASLGDLIAKLEAVYQDNPRPIATLRRDLEILVDRRHLEQRVIGYRRIGPRRLRQERLSQAVEEPPLSPRENRLAVVLNEVPQHWVSLGHLISAFELLYRGVSLPATALFADLEHLVDRNLLERAPGMRYRKLS